MKKLVSFMVGLLLLAGSVSAKPVDVATARRVAETYMSAMGMKTPAALQNITAQTSFTEFYVFAAEEGGFILVSADDCAKPVLGYSLTSVFEPKGIPENIRGWLEDYEKEIRYAKQMEARRGVLRTVGGTAVKSSPRQWQMLADGQMPPELMTYTPVPSLMTTTWGQSPYYNDLCPFDTLGNDRTVTGCVATATAQVMKYHNHPATGYGSYSYHAVNDSSDYGNLSANFGATTYQWSNMPDALTSTSSATQLNAVATLMYHVGVADGMDYNIGRRGGSGAQNYQRNGSLSRSSQQSLVRYFKYRPDMTVLCRDNFDDSVYCSMLRAEIDQSRPILYSGRDPSGGHSFVLDGYDAAGNFYVNWGWRGSYNGYYAMGALDPGAGGVGGNATYTFDLQNAALIGIRPNTNWSTSTPTTVTVTSQGGNANCAVYGSGSYAFGDTVSVEATTPDGYLFTGWNDGDRGNPRQFVATGGTYSFTGFFQPMQGDTLGYCPEKSHNITRYGVSTWGIRLPSFVVPQGHTLDAAMLYVGVSGTYTMNVYLGSNLTTPVATSAAYTFSSSDVGQWHTVPLTMPLTVDGTQDVVISFSSSDAYYPATVTYSSGNANGFLYGESLNAFNVGYSFMIRGIFSNPLPSFGDTISYCGDQPYAINIGTGATGNVYWGIKIPAANLVGHNYLKSAMVYVSAGYTGTYNLCIYTGGDTVPQTLALTRPVTFSVADTGWQEVMIPTTFPLTAQNLWVTFNTSDITYPMSACNYTGSPNSDWISLNGTTWNHCTDYELDYSWMIKAVLSNTLPPQDTTTYTITVLSNGLSQYCTVSGGGSFHYGDTTYIMAFDGGSSSTGYGAHFVRWNDGNTTSMRRIIVTGDATYVAIFEPTGNCPSISNFPYQWGFEGTLGCWTAVDNNNDTSTWRPLETPSGLQPHSGIGFAASFSYLNTRAYNADEYLVSPVISIPSGHSATLSWWFRVYPDYPLDKLAVKVSTSGNSPADFTTTLIDITPTEANGAWTQQTVDLSAYAGQNIYIAFHHHDSYDAFYLLLDDVQITASPLSTYTIIANSNNPAWGTVTGGGTYTSGATATLTATPANGYHFVQWNDGNTQNPRTVTVTGNATYTATFEADAPVQYTLTVQSNNPAWGTVTGGGTYTSGATATLTATPANGYHFVQWNDGNTQNPRTVTVTGNATYTATFEADAPVQYTLTVQSNNENWGTVTGGGTYNAGATAHLTATPKEGCAFVQWNDGETSAARDVTVTADRTYIATFIQNAGVEETEEVQWTLYPNPASGMVTIEGIEGMAEVTLTDIAGRESGQWKTQSGKLTIDVSALAPGTYFVRVASQGESAVRKLIVK